MAVRANEAQLARLESLESLRQLLARVLPDNPFYGKKFGRHGTRELPQSLEEFSDCFPLTSKTEFVADQAAHPPYGTNLSDPLSRYTRLHQTSGTTGAPLRWLDTPESWGVVVEDWEEVLKQAGVQPGDRIFFAFSFGPFLGFWGAFEAAQRLGCLGIAGGGMTSALRVRVLLENRCTVLCCTPTYALHLAARAREEGIDLEKSAVRLILVAGEPGGSLPATRARLTAAWAGARVFDHHGMTEVGPVTFEAPSDSSQPDRSLQPNTIGPLVVLERSHLVEVIDPVTARHVPLGQPGELVLTTLRRMACPAIRYRTGDLVCAQRAGPKSLLVFEGGILGRVDDMVVVRGVNIYPTAVDQVVRSIPETGEYRVTVDARQPMIELGVEVEGSEAVADELERRLRAQLGLRIPVKSVTRGTLPEFEGKARRWLRLG